MSIAGDRREWRHLANGDPMWAICAVPGRQGRWSEREFFESGERDVAGLLSTVGRLGLRVDPDRALDFGCGLGRLSRALSTRFAEVWALDLAPEMIAQAQRLNGDACRFEVNSGSDLRAVPSDFFVLVLSLITLQHVSDRDAIRSYIREFVRVAAPGGVIVVQLPIRVAWRLRLRPQFVVNRTLWRLPWQPAVVTRAVAGATLTALPEIEVRELLTGCGAEVVAALDDNRVGSSAVPSRCYFARKTSQA
jgi:SAM-dependent methyltransferase